MCRVIVLNGPPGAGKDTIAGKLDHVFEHLRFKDGLVPLVCNMYGVTPEWFQEQMASRERKEQPCPELFGKSPRQAPIHMSEQVIKPVFGPAVFGSLLAKRIEPNTLAVISDAGFADELGPLVEKVGSHNVLVVRLHRAGCTFANDSRTFLPDNVLGCRVIDVRNDGLVLEARQRILEAAGMIRYLTAEESESLATLADSEF